MIGVLRNNLPLTENDGLSEEVSDRRIGLGFSRLFGWLVFVFFAASLAVQADEFRPSLLKVTEREGGWVDVLWKVPTRGGKALAITPVLPEFLEPLGPGSGRVISGSWVENRAYRSNGQSLGGATFSIEGLGAVPADVMIRVELKDGTEHSTVLRSGNSSFTVPLRVTKWDVVTSYTRMGAVHILEGYDHLLFLLALLLIVSGFWKLIKTITAFTVAHSITLGLATLGLVNVPSAPTEAVISLSILFLAVELVRLRQGETPISAKSPWIVAFSFGLIHGLGFAGALSEVGVPQHEVPLALLMFNVGVEAGQILFVTTIAGGLALGRWLHKRWVSPIPELAGQLAPYAIGTVAAFWTIERTMSFLPSALGAP